MDWRSRARDLLNSRVDMNGETPVVVRCSSSQAREDYLGVMTSHKGRVKAFYLDRKIHPELAEEIMAQKPSLRVMHSFESLKRYARASENLSFYAALMRLDGMEIIVPSG